MIFKKVYKKNFKIKKLLKKNLIIISILIILFTVFLQKTNLTSNIYYLITKPHTKRFINAQNKNIFSGFCEKQSHGYIAFVANKFKHLFSQKNIPKIINLDEIRRKPYWIFLYSNYDINDQYIILLNANLDKNFDFSKFEILNNFQNKCFFLKRND